MGFQHLKSTSFYSLTGDGRGMKEALAFIRDAEEPDRFVPWGEKLAYEEDEATEPEADIDVAEEEIWAGDVFYTCPDVEINDRYSIMAQEARVEILQRAEQWFERLSACDLLQEMDPYSGDEDEDEKVDFSKYEHDTCVPYDEVEVFSFAHGLAPKQEGLGRGTEAEHGVICHLEKESGHFQSWKVATRCAKQWGARPNRTRDIASTFRDPVFRQQYADALDCEIGYDAYIDSWLEHDLETMLESIEEEYDNILMEEAMELDPEPESKPDLLIVVSLWTTSLAPAGYGFPCVVNRAA